MPVRGARLHSCVHMVTVTVLHRGLSTASKTFVQAGAGIKHKVEGLSTVSVLQELGE